LKTIHLTAIISSVIIVAFVTFVIATQSKPESQPGVYDYITSDYMPDKNKSWGTDIIQNQTFHFVDENMSDTWHKPTSLVWYDTNFTFPNGIEFENTPGGEIFEAYVTFPNETIPYRMAVGLGNNTDHKAITVLSTHKDPQVGYAIYDKTVRLLVNWPKVHSLLLITGLNNIYKAGQPIDFQIEAKGFDIFNAGDTPDVQIIKQDGTISWENPKFDVNCCPAELFNYDRKFNLTALGGPVTIDKPDSYKLIVSYNRQELEKQFTIILDENTKTIYVTNSNFSINYNVTNAQMLGIKLDKQSKSLIVSLQTSGDGQLTIELPRELIDAKMYGNTDDQFIVLENGQEIRYKEIHKTIEDRTLSISFQQGVDKIEIIGVSPI